MINDCFCIILVPGGWSDWKIVNADHCLLSGSTGKVKRLRFCDNPSPKNGGDLCANPEMNKDEISCSEIKNSGE